MTEKLQHTPGPWTPGQGDGDTWDTAAAPDTAAERDKLKEINAELLEALESCLARETERAVINGFADCNCINFSRDAEREYEMGECPHQKARQAIAKAKGTGKAGSKTNRVTS